MNYYPIQKSSFRNSRPADFQSVGRRMIANNDNSRLPPSPAKISVPPLLKGALKVFRKANPYIRAWDIANELINIGASYTDYDGLPYPSSGGWTQVVNDCDPPPTNKQRWEYCVNRYPVNLCASFDGGIKNIIDNGFVIPNWWTHMHVGGTYSAIGDSYSTRRFWTEAKYSRPSGTGTATEWQYPSVITQQAYLLPVLNGSKLLSYEPMFQNGNSQSFSPSVRELPILRQYRKYRQSFGGECSIVDNVVRENTNLIAKPFGLGSTTNVNYKISSETKRNTYERKVTIEQGFKLVPKKGIITKLRDIGYHATEFNDFVDCVHSALPDELQAEWGSTPQAKLEAIWKGRESLDYAQVIKNLIINEIEDRIVGKLNGLAGEGLKKLTKTTGLVYVKPYF